MKKNIRILFVFLLAAALQFTGFAGTLTAHAADVTNTVNIITGVSLTDRDGNPLGENIEKDAELRLTYEFSIPNTSEIEEYDTFTLHIPDEILIALPGNFEIRDNADNLIGTGTLSTDGTIVITFSAFPSEYSNVQGYFWFDLQFNEANIGNDDPTVITFEVGGTSEPVTINVDFEQPAPLPASIQKSGVFNEATNEITWTITADPGNTTVNNGQIVDILPEGQVFAGSVTIGGAPADPSNYSYEIGTHTFTYNFPAPISAPQVITFKTTPDDSIYQGAEQGDVIQVFNSATFNHDDDSTDSEENEVDIPVEYIEKSGAYDGANKKINWTIVVNQRGISIPNAMVTDTLPANVTLDTNSVMLDGTATSNFTYTHPTITFNLGTISEPHTITFSTPVDPSYYTGTNETETFTNNATFTGTNVPGNTSDGDGVGVSSSLIRKQGIAYDKVTGQITWQVTVNGNQVSVQNAVVTDHILIGQTYISGSATISGGLSTDNFSYTPAAVGDTEKTGTLTYTFGSTITQSYTITFKTQVTDPTVYQGNADTTYYNTASLSGSNIATVSHTGSQDVVSEVIKKTGEGYDYVSREISWKIVVNKNAMPLSGVVITDHIRPGQEYVADSAAIDNGASADNFSYTPAAVGDTEKTGTLTYTFAAPITQTYTITFKTKVTDLSVFNENGDVSFSNSAFITHSGITGNVTSSGSRTVHNTVISKEAAYTLGNTYIDWRVSINTNSVPLTTSEITDAFQEGLALDTTSVRLFRQTIDSGGDPHTGDEITLSRQCTVRL